MSIYPNRKRRGSQRKRDAIHVVSAVCGGGKTREALSYISTNSHKQNFIYTVPTIKLGERIELQLKTLNSNLDVVFIHDEGALGETYNYFRQKRKPSGHVLIVTWACWQLAHNLHNDKWNVLNHYQLIVDEIPSLAGAKFFNIQNEHFIFLRELLKPAKENYLDVVRLVAVDHAMVEKREKNGVIPKECRELFKWLLNGNFHVFAGADQWEAMLHHSNNDSVDLVTLLNPRPFKRSILMGANLEELLLYKWFNLRYSNVVFSHKHPITRGVRAFHHDRLGDAITVKFPRHKNFSKYVMHDDVGKWNQVTGNLNIDDMTSLIKEDMKAHGLNTLNYGFTANEGFSKHPFDTSLATSEHAVYIPPKAHGLNDYQHLNVMVNLCAMNPTPAQQELMGKLGFTYEDLRYDMMIDPFYQWVMRSGARSESPQGQFVFYAPDYSTAQAVAALTGASLEFIGDGVFPNKTPMSDQERKKKSLDMKFLLEYELPVDDKNVHESLIKYIIKGSRDKFCSLPMNHIHIGLCHDKKHVLPHQIFDLTYDRASFISHIKKFAKLKTTKDSAYSLIPSWFRRDTGKGDFRTKGNVLSVHCMALDVDGGVYSIHDFIADFGKKFCFVIYGTASCDESMTHYRVVLPYSQPCGVKEHEAVYEWFKRKMMGAKLDPSSKSGVGLFKLPFTGDNGVPLLEFFNMKRDSDLKKRIDPFEVARSISSKTKVVPSKGSTKKVNDLEFMKDAVRIADNKRTEFFTAMVKLTNAGYSETQIRQELNPLQLELGKTDWIDKGFEQITRYDRAA